MAHFVCKLEMKKAKNRSISDFSKLRYINLCKKAKNTYTGIYYQIIPDSIINQDLISYLYWNYQEINMLILSPFQSYNTSD